MHHAIPYGMANSYGRIYNRPVMVTLPDGSDIMATANDVIDAIRSGQDKAPQAFHGRGRAIRDGNGAIVIRWSDVLSLTGDARDDFGYALWNRIGDEGI